MKSMLENEGGKKKHRRKYLKFKYSIKDLYSDFIKKSQNSVLNMGKYVTDPSKRRKEIRTIT